MTVQSVLRVSLGVVLVWQIWFLHIRMGVGWGRQRKRKRAKQREGSKGKKKPKKPFEGLTRKPVCEQCAAEAEKQEQEEKREAPPKIERKRGRKQEIDTSKHFCPADKCPYWGWLDRGNIISNGHPSGGSWRQLRCVVCGKHFQETIGTIFYGSSVPATDIMRAIALLSEGVSPRKIARVFEGGQGYGVELVGGSGKAQRSSDRVYDSQSGADAGADGRIVCTVERDERRRGTAKLLGMDGNGLVQQAVAGCRGRGSESGDGTAIGARSGERVDTRSCTNVSDRSVGVIRESIADAFRLLGREDE